MAVVCAQETLHGILDELDRGLALVFALEFSDLVFSLAQRLLVEIEKMDFRLI